jgi:hypothetical protein
MKYFLFYFSQATKDAGKIAGLAVYFIIVSLW